MVTGGGGYVWSSYFELAEEAAAPPAPEDKALTWLKERISDSLETASARMHFTRMLNDVYGLVAGRPA